MPEPPATQDRPHDLDRRVRWPVFLFALLAIAGLSLGLALLLAGPGSNGSAPTPAAAKPASTTGRSATGLVSDDGSSEPSSESSADADTDTDADEGAGSPLIDPLTHADLAAPGMDLPPEARPAQPPPDDPPAFVSPEDEWTPLTEWLPGRSDADQRLPDAFDRQAAEVLAHYEGRLDPGHWQLDKPIVKDSAGGLTYVFLPKGDRGEDRVLILEVQPDKPGPPGSGDERPGALDGTLWFRLSIDSDSSANARR